MKKQSAISDQHSALSRMSPEEEAEFRAAVRQGIEQADRGELIEEEEMDARVKRMHHF